MLYSDRLKKKQQPFFSWKAEIGFYFESFSTPARLLPSLRKSEHITGFPVVQGRSL